MYVRRVNDIPSARVVATNMGNLFGRYTPEIKQPVRALKIKENEALVQLRVIWKDYDYNEMDSAKDSGIKFLELSDKLKTMKYSAEDVQNFSIVLAEFQEEHRFETKAGFFLSALINSGSDKSYTIFTDHLGTRISALGNQNDKNIIVIGDVGYSVGINMKNGSMLIRGNAGNWVGAGMTGGKIIVEGNAGEEVGYRMEGGTIEVMGNAGDKLGFIMFNGRIIIHGNIGTSVGYEMYNGEILVRGSAGKAVGAGMKNGKITVEGNAAMTIGSDMQGGIIIISGHAGGWIGLGMLGGEIHLNGTYEELAPAYSINGRIYHKGILIADKQGEK